MLRAGRSDGGFTLIELLAVLVILALVASQVAPRLLTLIGFQSQQTARNIATTIERSRERAIRNAATITLDPAEIARRLPATMALAGAPLVFYPNGGSNGGYWLLTSGENDVGYLSVDWLTGAVSTDFSR